MKKKMKQTSYRLTQVLIISGSLLFLNLLFAYFSSDWVNSVHDFVIASAGHSPDRIILTENASAGIVANQGGVNIQKTRENAEKLRDEVEGNPAATDVPAPEASAPEKPANEELKQPAPEAPETEKGKAKAPKAIDPEMLKRALVYFQGELTDRNVITIAMEDEETPYISKSFRDNPFDAIQSMDNLPNILKGLSKLPSPPLYPPPGEGREGISEEEFQKYIKTLELKGVVYMDGQHFAIIKAGSNKYTKARGDDFKDRILVNVDDVTFEGVLVSDEFGDKGLLDFNYKKGFQVQPIDNVLFISNYGSE